MMTEYRVDRKRVRYELEQAIKEIDSAMSRIVWMKSIFQDAQKDEYATFLESLAQGLLFLQQELSDFVQRFI